MNKRSFLFSMIGLLALGGAATALATVTAGPRGVIGGCDTGRCAQCACCEGGECCCPDGQCCCADGASCDVAPASCC